MTGGCTPVSEELATRLDGVAAARRPFVRRAIGRLVLANEIIYIYMCYSATG